jgi:hypothetical protein
MRRRHLPLATVGIAAAAAVAGARLGAGWSEADIFGLALAAADVAIAIALGMAARQRIAGAAVVAIAGAALVAIAALFGLDITSPWTALPVAAAAASDPGGRRRLVAAAIAAAVLVAASFATARPAPVAAATVAAGSMGLEAGGVSPVEPRAGDPLGRTTLTTEAVAARAGRGEGGWIWTLDLASPHAGVAASRLVATLAFGLYRDGRGGVGGRIACVVSAAAGAHLVCAAGPRVGGRERRRIDRAAATGLLAEAYPLGVIAPGRRRPGDTGVALIAYSTMRWLLNDWTAIELGPAALAAVEASSPFLGSPPPPAARQVAARLALVALAPLAFALARRRRLGRGAGLAAAASLLVGAGAGLSALAWIGLSGGAGHATGGAWLIGAALSLSRPPRRPLAAADRGPNPAPAASLGPKEVLHDHAAGLAAAVILVGLAIVGPINALFGGVGVAVAAALAGALAGAALAATAAAPVAAAAVAAAAAAPLLAAAVGLPATAAAATLLLAVAIVLGSAIPARRGRAP